MKNLLCVIVSAFVLMSCNDMGSSPLKGKWQLKTVEKEDVVSSVDTVWYNFQSESLFAMQIYLVRRDTFLMPFGFRKEHEKILEIEMTSPHDLDYTDWKDVKRKFTIEKCKGDELILVSEENYIYRFIRF